MERSDISPHAPAETASAVCGTGASAPASPSEASGSRVALRPHPDWLRSGASPSPEFTPPPGEDPLEAFLRWYGAHGPAFPMAPAGAPFFADGLTGLRLYRSGPFQVELFLFPAGTCVPAHRHPNVDTIEMHLAGDYDFRVTVAGRLVSSIPLPFLHDRRGPVSRWWGRGVRVRPETVHDLRVGSTVAAFLSLQHWHLVPEDPARMTVGMDWEGAPVNPEHGEQICRP